MPINLTNTDPVHYVGLEWISNLLSIPSTSDFREIRGTERSENDGKKEAQMCLRYIEEQCGQAKATSKLIAMLGEYYAGGNRARNKMRILSACKAALERKYAANYSLDKQKVAAIALYRATNAHGLHMTSAEIIGATDLVMEKRNFNKTWRPAIDWMTNELLRYLSLADQCANDYRYMVREVA